MGIILEERGNNTAELAAVSSLMRDAFRARDVGCSAALSPDNDGSYDIYLIGESGQPAFSLKLTSQGVFRDDGSCNYAGTILAQTMHRVSDHPKTTSLINYKEDAAAFANEVADYLQTGSPNSMNQGGINRWFDLNFS